MQSQYNNKSYLICVNSSLFYILLCDVCRDIAYLNFYCSLKWVVFRFLFWCVSERNFETPYWARNSFCSSFRYDNIGRVVMQGCCCNQGQNITVDYYKAHPCSSDGCLSCVCVCICMYVCMCVSVYCYIVIKYNVCYFMLVTALHFVMNSSSCRREAK